MGFVQAAKESISSFLEKGKVAEDTKRDKFDDILVDVKQSNLKDPEYYFEKLNIAKKIVILPVLDALRTWIIVNEKNAEEIEHEMEIFKLKDKIQSALIVSRLFGSVLVIAKTLGDMGEYYTPFKQSNYSSLEDFFIVREYTKNYDSNGFLESYTVNVFNKGQTIVHISRALEICQEDYQKYFNIHSEPKGVLSRDSIRQALEDYEEKFAIDMYSLRTDGTTVYKMKGLNEAAQSGQYEAAREKVKIFSRNKLRSKTATIDSEDDMNIMSLQMGHIEAFMNNLMTRLSAEADIPIIVLFGVQLYNNTGQASISNYYNTLEGIQRGPIQSIIDFYLKMKYPNRVLYTIKSPELLTDLEKAQMLYTIAQTDDINIQNEVYTSEEARNRYHGDNPAVVINIDDSNNNLKEENMQKNQKEVKYE